MWSASNLPEVLFYLELPENPQKDVKPESFVRDDNTILRKFDILPEYIAVDVEGESQKDRVPVHANERIGWLVHAWRSLDSRIMLSDITDRMIEDPDYFGHVLKKPPANALSNHSYRGCRKILGSYNDYARRDQPHRATVESIEKLSFEKIWTNSVLSRSVEFPDRLVRLKFARKGKDSTGQYEAKPVEVTQENYLETTFPIDHFCLQEFDPCVVSELEDKLLPAMLILFDLQRKAELHGLAHWKDLEKECMPESWFDRTREGAPEKLTFDGGCEVCTWQPGQDAPPPKATAFNFDYLRHRSAEKSATFDLSKAFQKAGKSAHNAFKQEGDSKRSRTSSIEQDLQRSLTPMVSSAMVLHHPSSAPPALPAKRVKLRSSKRAAKRAAILDEDPHVPELPLAASLVKGTRYKIKYLEKDDQYTGFWETDTEVELDSDAETVVDLTADVEVKSKAQPPPSNFPASPPNTPYATLSQAQAVSIDAVMTPAATYSPLPAMGYLPTDFLNSGCARNDLLGVHLHELAPISGAPPDDPFSSFNLSSSFESFTPRDCWSGHSFSDFDGQNVDLNSNRLRGQTMKNLLQQSAALHSVMSLNSDEYEESVSRNRSSGDNASGPASAFNRHVIDPSFIADSSSYPQLNRHSQLIPTHDPVTPYKYHDQTFSNLIFTDELNRFEGFGNYPSDSALEESPSKNLGHSSVPSINIYPTSPTRASIGNAKRRIFTINEDEKPEL